MIDRFDFLGTQISAVNLSGTVDFLNKYDYSTPNYICFPDSYVVTLANKNMDLRTVLNQSLLTLPDGKPSQIVARIKGLKQVSTVSGFWLCKYFLDSGYSHYFLGSTDEKLKKIEQHIKENHPRARVSGYSTLPFKPIEYFQSGEIVHAELEKINNLKPDFIWIGMSSPKQDFFMRDHSKLLKHGVMIGVGGVFDYLSGEATKSPEWVKRIGLRWLWRLAKEPQRLAGKYLYTFYNLVKYLLSKSNKRRVTNF